MTWAVVEVVIGRRRDFARRASPKPTSVCFAGPLAPIFITCANVWALCRRGSWRHEPPSTLRNTLGSPRWFRHVGWSAILGRRGILSRCRKIVTSTAALVPTTDLWPFPAMAPLTGRLCTAAALEDKQGGLRFRGCSRTPEVQLCSTESCPSNCLFRDAFCGQSYGRSGVCCCNASPHSMSSRTIPRLCAEWPWDVNGVALQFAHMLTSGGVSGLF